ncbi:MAG: hypothetical protein KAT11_00780 [Phycisphaerae bacterium]|nr:hypothetical protein [Phycisphaerae bacterium]
MKAAMLRKPTARIPTMPQICHDVCIRIKATAEGTDWLEGYRQCAESPDLIYEYVIELARRVCCDGLRLFVLPDPMRVVREGDRLVVLDEKTDKRKGIIDSHGGGIFVPDVPVPPVETLAEANARLQNMVEQLSDEKIDLLRNARARVPELFVASAPGGITMNTYTELRGREQGMIDFYERPSFVSAVMSMQAEAMIQRAEKLLNTGIDALYIGDPSASASLLSPKHFETFCLPAYKQFCQHFAGKDILNYIHICGNSRPILEMMADTGANAIEPLDPLGGVEVSDAKARVGDRVALMGGVNTLTLSNGSVQEVREESIRKCKEGGPSGYILASGDMVPPATPLANLQAMVNVARESSWR